MLTIIQERTMSIAYEFKNNTNIYFMLVYTF